MADFELTGEIRGEPDPESLGRVKAAFSEAMIQALTSPQVKAAANRLAVTIGQAVAKAMKNVSKGTESEFRKMREQARQAAKAMGDAFTEVGRKARDSLNIPTRNTSLGTLEQSIASIADRMEELSGATKEQIRLLEVMMRAQGAATRARSQEARDAVLSSTQAARQQIVDSQKQIAAARDAANIQVATIRATSRQAIQTSRAMVRVFELTWKSAERAVRAFGRAAGAILRGLQSAAANAFRGIGSIVSRTFSAATRGISQFAQGITRGFAAISRAIASAMRRDEQAITGSFRRREAAFNASLSRQAHAAQRFQTQRSTGLLSGLGGGGLLAGAAGGAGIFQLLTSGFERFGQQEQLQLTFEALLRDGPAATSMLSQISDYARTTAFDFVEVASSVAQLTATLGDVDQAFDMTTFLSDVVALTGGTTEALGRVRLAMTQIASAGRLDSANLRQLTESLPGVPFAQILADKFFEGDVAAYSKARDAGELGAKISAEAFFAAFEEGVTTRFPEVEGFAQTAATTVTGLAQNLKENFAIFGATLIGLGEGPIKGFIGNVNRALDVLGQFVRGTGRIFGGDTEAEAFPGAVTREPGEVNPFAALADSSMQRFNAGMGRITIPFEELPQEMQDILHERHGWGPNQGYVLAAEHAEQLWDALHPPPEIEEGANRLRELREIVGDMAQSIGIVLGLAAAFKVLQLSLIAITSPLGLIVLAAGALGFIWNRLKDNSVILRNALSGLFANLTLLGDAFKETIGLVLGLISTAIFGDSNFFKNIGDSVGELVGHLSRGIGYFTEWLTWANDMIRIGEVDLVFADIGERVTSWLDSLENVPVIGPVTRFVRRVASEVANVISGIWDIIFGNDQGGGGTAAVGITPPPQQQAMGTRILDFLETTFLDPIVSFFRGPFANIAETVGGYVVDAWDGLWGLVFGGAGSRTMEGAAAAGGAGAVMGGPENTLKELFLDPILRFFSQTLPNAVGTIAGYIADFWDRVFREGIGRGGMSEGQLAAAIIGGGDVSSEGFLRPLIDSFLNFPAQLQAEGWGEAVSGIWDGLVESARNIWDGGGDKGGGGIKGALSDLWSNITSWFSDLDWSQAISGAAIAGAIGIAVAGLPGLLIGLTVGAIGGNLGWFQPIVDAISSAWTEQILPALDGLWADIRGWFQDTFTTSNFIAAAKVGLSGIESLGEEIGQIIGDPMFVGIVAGAGAAIIAGIGAVILAFTVGLAKGIAENADQWGEIIGSGIEAAFNAIPGVDVDLSGFVDSITGLFEDPVIGTLLTISIGLALAPVILGGIAQGVKAATTQKGGIATRAAVGLLGIAGGLVSEFTRALTTVVKNQSILTPLFNAISKPSASSDAAATTAAKGAVSSLANRMYQAVLNPSSGFRNTLRAIGPGIAAIVAGGVAGFATGQALAGESLIEQILGVGGLAAGLSLLSVPAGIAAGALGILGIAMGNSAEQARQAKDRIAELQAALEEGAGAGVLGGLDETDAERIVSQTFRQRLSELSSVEAENWGQSFAENIDFGRIAQQAIDQIPAESPFVDYLKNLGDEIAAQGDLSAQEWAAVVDDFIAIAEEKDVSLENLLRQPSLGGDEFRSQLDAAGVSMEDLLNILDFLQTGFEDTAEAQGHIAWDKVVEGSDEAAGSLDTVAEAVERINDLISSDMTVDQIAAILDTETGGNTALAFDALEQAGADVASQMETTRQAIVDALAVATEPVSRRQLGLDFVTGLESVQSQLENLKGLRVEGEISDIQLTAETAAIESNVREDILGIIQQGLDSGLLQTDADVSNLLAQMLRNTEDSDLGPDATNLITGVITELQTAAESGDLTPLFDALLAGDDTLTKIQELMATNQTTAVEAFTNPSTVGETMGPVINKLLDPEALRGVIEAQATAARKIYDTQFASGGLSSAELTAAVISSSGGQTRIDTGGEGVGEGLVDDVTAGISGAADDAADAAAEVVDGVLDEFRSASQAAGLYGAAAGQRFADGLGATGQQAVNNARFIAAGAANAMNVEGAMYNQGSNAGAGFARGILSRVRGVVAAAALMAIAAIQAVRNVLQSASPSKVFINIGKDIGTGFIQGIKDSEGDMAAAISSAIEGAVTKGVKDAGVKVQRAQAAGEIFRLLQPSLLPGGITDVERTQETLAARLGALGTRRGLQEGAADALGGSGNAALRQALDQVQFLGRGTAASVMEMNEAFKEAQSQKQAIADYGDRLAQINYHFKTGYLGQLEYNKRLAEMREQVKTGAMSTESFNDQLKILKRELSLGILNREAREAAMQALGSRPDQLTYEQQQLLAAGPRTLDARFAQGLENREAIFESLDTIRQWGQEALASGQSLTSVIAGMQKYRDSLVSQLKAFGFNTTQINAIVEAAGLSNAALQTLRNTLTSLNVNTEAGAQNVANFLEQFVSIREFGQRMLEAGVGAQSVVNQMKAFRDSIVNQAVAFGFNRDQINKLVEQIGLSDAQLKAFIAQLNNFNTAAANAEKTATEAARAAAAREKAEREKEEREAREKALEESRAIVNRPTIERLQVFPPYGDPEAIALSTWNRFTYGALNPT